VSQTASVATLHSNLADELDPKETTDVNDPAVAGWSSRRRNVHLLHVGAPGL